MTGLTFSLYWIEFPIELTNCTKFETYRQRNTPKLNGNEK